MAWMSAAAAFYITANCGYWGVHFCVKWTHMASIDSSPLPIGLSSKPDWPFIQLKRGLERTLRFSPSRHKVYLRSNLEGRIVKERCCMHSRVHLDHLREIFYPPLCQGPSMISRNGDRLRSFFKWERNNFSKWQYFQGDLHLLKTCFCKKPHVFSVDKLPTWFVKGSFS